MKIGQLYPKGSCIPSVWKALHLHVQTKMHSHAGRHLCMQWPILFTLLWVSIHQPVLPSLKYQAKCSLISNLLLAEGLQDNRQKLRNISYHRKEKVHQLPLDFVRLKDRMLSFYSSDLGNFQNTMFLSQCLHVAVILISAVWNGTKY